MALTAFCFDVGEILVNTLVTTGYDELLVGEISFAFIFSYLKLMSMNNERLIC